MWQKVTEGIGANTLSNLKIYEDLIAEGQRIKLDLTLRQAPGANLTNALADILRANSIPATVESSGTTASIIAKKGFPWLALIAASIVGLIILAILIMSWILWKEVEETVPKNIMVIGVIVGIILVAAVAWMLIKPGGASAAPAVGG